MVREVRCQEAGRERGTRQGVTAAAKGDTLRGDMVWGNTLQSDVLKGDTLQGDALQLIS